MWRTHWLCPPTVSLALLSETLPLEVQGEFSVLNVISKCNARCNRNLDAEKDSVCNSIQLLYTCSYCKGLAVLLNIKSTYNFCICTSLSGSHPLHRRGNSCKRTRPCNKERTWDILSFDAGYSNQFNLSEVKAKIGSGWPKKTNFWMID